MADITMPQLGETVTEGTITKWFKQVGDEIKEDEVLFEVSTDKVDSEVPSPSSGFVAEILVQEGETVDVGTKLAVITSEAPAGGGDGGDRGAPAEAEEEAEAEEPTAGDEEGGGEARADDDDQPAVAEERGPAPEEASPEPEAVDEEREAAAASEDGDRDKVKDKDEGKDKDAKDEKAEDAEAEAAPAATKDDGGGKGGDKADGRILSPVVRRLIKENQLDPDQIEGTGAGGRITRTDVLGYLDAGGKREAPVAAAATSAPTKAPAPAPAQPAAAAKSAPAEPKQAAAAAAPAGQGDEVIPFSNIRRRTAEHMVRSKSTSAHVLCAIEVDFEAVDRVRRAMKDRYKAEEGHSLTYLPFISRALVDAIREFPHVNASVGDDALVVHHAINLGIAVDLDFQGLLAPVVKDADGLRLRAIARQIHDLATRARTKKLSADDITGGTFTITNPGPFGTFLTAPIINQPQVAILSTDGVKKRPVAIELPDGSDGIAVHATGNLALSFDHRAFDGAYAAAFIRRIKEFLETRDWAAEL